jgi:Tol biopolymer transport system component
MSQSQDTHGHSYLSPDAKWMVFNSDRTGQPQIHVASIPDAIVADVLSED